MRTTPCAAWETRTTGCHRTTTASSRSCTWRSCMGSSTLARPPPLEHAIDDRPEQRTYIPEADRGRREGPGGDRIDRADLLRVPVPTPEGDNEVSDHEAGTAADCSRADALDPVAELTLSSLDLMLAHFLP